MVKLIVEGQAYEMDENTKSLIQFIEKSEALEGAKEEINIPNVTKVVFEKVLELCKITGYKFPEVGKVKSSDAKEYIGNNLTDYFSGQSCKRIYNKRE